MRTDDLITQLSAGLKPVRRVWHPVLATAFWLALVTAIIAAAVLVFGLRHDLDDRLAAGFDRPQLLSAGATGVLAAFAAFQLALPDRDRRWALLPLPAIAAWLATMGWGCLRDFARDGLAGLSLTTSFPCLAFIVGLGLPLTLAAFWSTRHAATVRPGVVASLGGLSAAALASVGLSLIHHLDSAVMVLAWHGMAVALVTLAASYAGPRLMPMRAD
jgi:hypothetical protein